MQEQAMCAAQAQRVYEKDKADPVSANLVGYENHYNPTMNRCFMLERDVGNAAGKIMVTITLADAFEGHGLATYTSTNGQLFDCELTPTYQTMTRCKSGAEFNAFVKQYMGSVFGGAE